MADNLQYNKPTSGGPDRMGHEIDKMLSMAENQRKSYERKWYEHNFFDDGYHFRLVSRTTGKIVDLQDAGSSNMPQRAIPKASRQIRGIANLLLSPKYVPVVYPKRVTKANFSQYVDGKIIYDEEAYNAAKNKAKNVAQKQGSWLEEEWRDQYLRAKITQILIGASKQSVNYLKIYPNAEEEMIETSVRDAFDLYLMGNLTDIEASPFVIEAYPTLISDIKANPLFDEEQKKKINPDNKYASSEIKQAYMQSRYGFGNTADDAATLILKEAFIKTRLSQDNVEDVMAKTSDPDILAGKRMGQTVMHHVYSAGGVCLLDEYLDMQEYPYVPYTFEPGPLYQKSLIENFIPANKSLDIVVSRVEKYVNTMVTGIYAKRKGENFEVANIPGGQVVEYTTTPPIQMSMANLPQGVFELIGFFNQVIEEQGASTSALGVLPQGVKSGVAIESVKATEYANLEIASEQLKDFICKVSNKMLKIADSYFMKPKETAITQSGEQEYFDVIGKRGIQARQQLGVDIPQDVVPLDGDTKVRIEVESGLGFTMEGKKQTMQQIIEFMLKLAELGMLSTDAVKVLVQRFMEVYQFGSTAEFMEAMESGTQAAPLNEEQINQMKVAFVEAAKDSGMVGPQADQKLVDSTKLGTVEALKDTGMLERNQAPAQQPNKVSISYKDLPIDGKTQAAGMAGIQLTPEQVAQQEILDKLKKESSAKNSGNGNAKE